MPVKHISVKVLYISLSRCHVPLSAEGKPHLPGCYHRNLSCNYTYQNSSGNAFVVTNQIYESPLSRGSDGNLQPRLATEWKSVDGTTWEFKLRQGVKFQDGTPFNADAVKFSIERLKNPDTKAPGAYIVTMVNKVVDENTPKLETVVMRVIPEAGTGAPST